MHRFCRGVDIGCIPFNLMEAWTWVHREKWNIVWAEDETWLPSEQDVVMNSYLPHGFRKVLVHETDEDFLTQWVTVAGRGLYPFAAEVHYSGFSCWANSRRFAIVARSPQQCAVIAEVMHASNVLGNRIEVYAPQKDGIALTDRNRINTAVHEDDRPFFFVGHRHAETRLKDISPCSSGDADRAFHLSENIHLLQRQHNDLVHEANQAVYRAQQSWQLLSEAYAALFTQ